MFLRYTKIITKFTLMLMYLVFDTNIISPNEKNKNE